MWKWIIGGIVAAAFLAFGIATYIDANAPHMPVTTNVGPPADVIKINRIVLAGLGRLAKDADVFSVVDGDYAVNALNLGEGWGTGAFQRKNGTWKSLDLAVNTDPCSLTKAGFPGDVAQRISRNFEGRMLHHGGEPYKCWTMSTKPNSSM